MAKKLEEIKEEECPYELPDGWKWERLGNIAEVVSGGTPSSKVKEYYNGRWVKRYFAKYEDGKIYAWDNGSTSWSADNASNRCSNWDCAKLAE